jgi:transposase
VSADNPVRAIDAYVDSLDLQALGFQHAGGEMTPGQPAFPLAALLKLCLYGYLHRVRSSRQLEAECQRNLEVIWLVGGLRPGYKTIADFRKDNLPPLKAVNRDFVQLCKELDLFGAELVGIDGSFFRGNVGKKSLYTQDRLQRALLRVEQDIARYLQALEQADQQADPPSPSDPRLAEKLTQLRERQQKRRQLQQLEESGQTQIAEVDPDARLLSKPGQGSLAGYNVQVAVDEKHKLLVVGQVVQDGNDEQQLLPMAQAAQAELGVEALNSVEDAGYFNAVQLKQCMDQGITPYVPEPDKQAQTRQQGRFTQADFCYEAQTHTVVCPAGQRWVYHATRKKGDKILWDFRSTPGVCAACPLKGQCLPAKTPYGTLTRWEHEAILEAHRARMHAQGAEKMRQRAALCEHPFGTLKLGLGWTHFCLRGLAKVRAEFSRMMLSYNFRRVLNLLGLEGLRSYCRARRRASPVLSG